MCATSQMILSKALWARTNFSQTWMCAEELHSESTEHSCAKHKNTLPGSNQPALHEAFVSSKNNQQSPAAGFTAN